MQQVKSNRDRKELMATFSESSQQDLDAGKPILPEDIINNAFVLNIEYQTAYTTLNISYSLRRNAVSEHGARIDGLSKANSDFHATLERRSRRLNHPPGVVDFYKTPADYGRPQGTTHRRVMQLARDILEGEKQAVAQNFPAMANPSAEDIQVLLTKAAEAAQALTHTERAYQEAQLKVQALSLRVDQMVADLNRSFKTATPELSDSARRRLMRRYGFSFVNEDKDIDLENEVNDEFEEPSAPPSEENQSQPSGESAIIPTNPV